MTLDRAWLDGWIAHHHDDLVAVRRHIHAHPELGRAEVATTGLVEEWLTARGLAPRRLSTGTGLVCDIGTGGPIVALRADLDALPLQDEKDVPYRSTVEGVCHACGHDVHTTVLLGAALAIVDAGGPERGTLRLVFQPAEELVPGGALDVIAAGELTDVKTIVALHCDPRLDVGHIGIREGVITAASDSVEVRLTGPGGHTARPELTVDLVSALARVALDVPALLARQVDPTTPFSLVWGAVAAGAASNVIPTAGILRGSVRTMDPDLWDRAEVLVRSAVEAAAAGTGAAPSIDYKRGVPPVVNDAGAADLIRRGVTTMLGADAVAPTPASMGGEDFGWYLQTVPGALARLGVRPIGAVDEQSGPLSRPGADLHRATFDVDEAAIGVGVRALVGTALAALPSQ